ncbi:MAG: 23S rRNA (guanosine(2251)-2'-O)-methyltransferase RlmB [Bacilli bacterium]|nr:23S rRNA (guanosine(2251)-2'-O)-methyltransferase RlmB [Bacilli bacterium]
MRVYGKNVFNEVKNDYQKIIKVYLSNTFKDEETLSFIKENNINYQIVDNKVLDNMEKGLHQGIIIEMKDYEYYDLKALGDEDTVVILDHLEDPHNLGAIIRTCEASGIKSIIIPKDRSVRVNATVMKTSAGALEHVKVIMVNNLVNTIKDLKKNNFFIYAADMDGVNYKSETYPKKVALVIGSEGFGLSRLVKENTDIVLSIPMRGRVNSLNASVAAALLIYEIMDR